MTITLEGSDAGNYGFTSATTFFSGALSLPLFLSVTTSNSGSASSSSKLSTSPFGLLFFCDTITGYLFLWEITKGSSSQATGLIT